MNKIYSRITIMLTCLMISSCANLCPDPLSKAESNYQQVAFKQRQQKLSNIRKWTLKGSFSVTFPRPKTHKLDTQMARFQWQQNPDPQQYTIDMLASFDVAKLTIKSDTSGITLKKNDTPQPHTYASPEALTQAALGFTLPVSNLYFWIRGVVSPLTESSAPTVDHFQHLIHIQQGNWSVSFSHFITTKQGDLPLRILIQNPEKQLKLIIVTRKESWKEWCPHHTYPYLPRQN